MGAGQDDPIGAQQIRALEMENLVGEHVIGEVLLLEPVNEMKVGAELMRAAEIGVLKVWTHVDGRPKP